MRVFVVDSHPIVRVGLKQIMSVGSDFTLTGESDTWRSIPQGATDHCDLIILDGEIDSLNYLVAFNKDRRRGRPPYVLVLSRHDEDQHAIQMLAAGADGYIRKTENPQVILQAIRKVALGRKHISRELAEGLLLNLNRTEKPVRLSNREYEVLYLFASGLGMSAIADQLSLSVKTVSTYRSRLLEKLSVNTNAELMRYAFKEGIAP